MPEEKKYHFKKMKGCPLPERKPFNFNDWQKDKEDRYQKSNIIIEPINDIRGCNAFKISIEDKHGFNYPLSGLIFNDFSAFGNELKSPGLVEIEPGIYLTFKIDGLIRPKRKTSLGVFGESLIRM